MTKNVPQGAKRPKGNLTRFKFRRNDDFLLDRELNVSTKPIKSSISEHDKSSEKDTYKIKIKTINKTFLDKNTKLQIELIDENEQSEMTIVDQIDNNINAFTIDTTKHLGSVCS